MSKRAKHISTHGSEIAGPFQLHSHWWRAKGQNTSTLGSSPCIVNPQGTEVEAAAESAAIEVLEAEGDAAEDELVKEEAVAEEVAAEEQAAQNEDEEAAEETAVEVAAEEAAEDAATELAGEVGAPSLQQPPPSRSDSEGDVVHMHACDVGRRRWSGVSKWSCREAADRVPGLA
jgi:hypothetical protein